LKSWFSFEDDGEFGELRLFAHFFNGLENINVGKITEVHYLTLVAHR